MATREAYARVWTELYDNEMTVGVELREGDALAEMTLRIKDWAFYAMMDNQLEPLKQVAKVEAQIKNWYPDRAYFIETESAGRGVQVFQPYGLPRLACPAPDNDKGLEAFATFGTWEGPGHREGCEKLPRTARGCYCGGDHQ